MLVPKGGVPRTGVVCGGRGSTDGAGWLCRRAARDGDDADAFEMELGGTDTLAVTITPVSANIQTGLSGQPCCATEGRRDGRRDGPRTLARQVTR